MDHQWNLVVRRVNERGPGIVRFSVKLTPKGGRNAIEGWQSGVDTKPVLKARVAAPPEDGKANAALVSLIADRLGIGKSKVRVVSGLSSRMKIVEVEGEAALITARLARAEANA